MDPADERLIVSFWASPKTTKLPAAMPSLHRWKDQDRIHYMDTHPGAKDPLPETLIRLGKAGHALAAIERVSMCLSIKSERNERLVGQIRDIAERLWEWHSIIRLLRAPTNSDKVKIAMNASWVVMIKAFYLSTAAVDILRENNYDAMPVVLSHNVWETFPFLELLRFKGRGILFTNPTGMMSSLSLSQWITTYREFRRVYIRTGFSPSASTYFRALLCQYGYFIHNRHETVTAQMRCYDIPSYLTQAPFLPSELLMAPLNDELITKHEADLFYAMRHLRAARTFYEAGHWDPMPLEERKMIIKALCSFVRAMLADRKMYTSFAGKVRTNLLRRALQPGDSDIHHRARDLKPSKTQYADAGEILSSQRHEFYNTVTGRDGFNQDTPDTHMKIWAAELEKLMDNEPDEHEAFNEEVNEIRQRMREESGRNDDDDDDNDAMDIDEEPPLNPTQEEEETIRTEIRSKLWDYISVERSNREFVILLIIQTDFDIYTQYASRINKQEEFDLQRHAYLDDAALPPPLDDPPSSPHEALHKFIDGMGYKPPFMIVLSHLYAIITPEETWVTPRLEEAFVLWMREAVRRGQLSKNTIHPTLVPLLLPQEQLVAAWTNETAIVPHGPRLTL
jgi:hypothetical protein